MKSKNIWTNKMLKKDDAYINLCKAWYEHQKVETVESYKNLTSVVAKIEKHLENNENDRKDFLSFYINGEGWLQHFPYLENYKEENVPVPLLEFEESCCSGLYKYINIDLQYNGLDGDVNTSDELIKFLEKKEKQSMENTNTENEKVKEEEVKQTEETETETSETKKEESKEETKTNNNEKQTNTEPSCKKYKFAIGAGLVLGAVAVGLSLWNHFKDNNETVIINVDDI